MLFALLEQRQTTQRKGRPVLLLMLMVVLVTKLSQMVARRNEKGQK